MKKLLLTVDLPPLGFTGDVVEVKEGYARNYLIPKGFAIEPSPENLKRIEKAKKQSAERRAKLLAEKKAIAERINGLELTINATANPQGHLFGSVSQKEIADALTKEGYNILPEEIKLQHHIKEIGEYQIKIELAHEVEATVNLKVLSETSETQEESKENEQTE